MMSTDIAIQSTSQSESMCIVTTFLDGVSSSFSDLNVVINGTSFSRRERTRSTYHVSRFWPRFGNTTENRSSLRKGGIQRHSSESRGLATGKTPFISRLEEKSKLSLPLHKTRVC